MSKMVQSVANFAQEVGVGDPIDFGMLSIDERTAYELAATGVLEQWSNCPRDDREFMLMAVATNLTVANMVLNIQLMQAMKNHK